MPKQILLANKTVKIYIINLYCEAVSKNILYSNIVLKTLKLKFCENSIETHVFMLMKPSLRAYKCNVRNACQNNFAQVSKLLRDDYPVFIECSF